jgi:hypothetical protein
MEPYRGHGFKLRKGQVVRYELIDGPKILDTVKSRGNHTAGFTSISAFSRNQGGHTLTFKRRSRSEQPGEQRPQQSAGIPHLAFGLPDSTSPAARMTSAIGTGSSSGVQAKINTWLCRPCDS